MTLDDYDTLKEWIEAELKDRKESWSDVIYHNLTEDELSQPWNDDVEQIYIWTNKYVYVQIDSENCGYYLDCVPRNPPMEGYMER